MMSRRGFGFSFRGARLALVLGLICLPAVYGQPKTLTIENNSVLPLTVFLDGQEGRPTSVIGFVDPVSRKTFDYALQDGRWYVTIEPYAPGTRVKPLAFTLYVKADKYAYVYEVLDRDFGGGPILPPDNVSIIGRWASGPWMNGVGMVVDFAPKGDGYVGAIVSCSSELFLRRTGYYVGMELITGLKRTKINRYDGFIKEPRRDGTLANENFGVLIERGRELFPLGWTRMDTQTSQSRFGNVEAAPSLQVTATELKFYEGGVEGVAYGQRRYGLSFPRSSSRFVHWELNFAHPAPGRQVDFQVEAVFYNPDGSEMGRSTINTFVGADWWNSQHFQGRGWSEPGRWNPGRYRVELFISGARTASGEFEIEP